MQGRFTASMETANVTNVTEALQGALPNVDILTGADPGAGTSIRIRGTSSLSASAEPLFVLDGVPMPVNVSSDFNFATANSDDYSQLLNVSPSDIQSIEVLKDAAATAIYGSKAANGALLITTKKGSKGRMAFSYSSKYETTHERNSIPMLNAKQYVSMMQDALWNRLPAAWWSAVGLSKAKSVSAVARKSSTRAWLSRYAVFRMR